MAVITVGDMWIVAHRKALFIFTALMVAAAVGAVAVFGLKFGIDFTGGMLIEVAYEGERPSADRVELRLTQADIGGFSLRATDDAGYLLRTKPLAEEKVAAVLDALRMGGAAQMEVVRRTHVGPTIGEELRRKALVAIAVVVVIIVLFVAFAFRDVAASKEGEKKQKEHAPHRHGVSSFTYGLIAIAALLHDIIIPVGVYAALGYFWGAEADVLFVMALLAILGYSVNDTIVVFDRVRELLRLNAARGVHAPFAEVVGKALDASLARSVNTSFTTLLTLAALIVWGAEVTRYFAVTLMAGVIAGTYSSLVLAPTLLIAAYERGKKKKA